MDFTPGQCGICHMNALFWEHKDAGGRLLSSHYQNLTCRSIDTMESRSACHLWASLQRNFSIVMVCAYPPDMKEGCQCTGMGLCWTSITSCLVPPPFYAQMENSRNVLVLTLERKFLPDTVLHTRPWTFITLPFCYCRCHYILQIWCSYKRYLFGGKRCILVLNINQLP